jgi:hypothetical protein
MSLLLAGGFPGIAEARRRRQSCGLKTKGLERKNEGVAGSRGARCLKYKRDLVILVNKAKIP